MDTDLVLEGGGVKGIGLVGAVSVLDAAGYRFRRVAGTSAGAIVGSLVAAGMPPNRMEKVMRQVDYGRFRDKGGVDHVPLVGRALSLLFKNGVYEGNYLEEWLGNELADLGVRTFGDLRIDDGVDPESDLPPERSYRLVVMASDVSEARLIRFPWDYGRLYGLDPDRQLVVAAVRASMSIPFFFEPVKLTAAGGKEMLLVDGGMLSNFPIDVFDRVDGRPPRWPTFGIKLSARPDANQALPEISGPLSFAGRLLATLVNAHDQMHLDDPCVVRRTLFVDTGQVNSVDFDLDAPTRDRLFTSGRKTAGDFLASWDWQAYLASCRT